MENLTAAGPFCERCFTLADRTKRMLRKIDPDFGFGGLGGVVFYRTYSRKKADGTNENWADVVIRVMEGVMSIRKNHTIKNYLPWDEVYWQHYAFKMSQYMATMKFLPPGRGMWACGTDFMYERGSAALNNCGAVSTKDLPIAVAWAMDMLMNGCGIGFDTWWDGEAHVPEGEGYTYVIPDSREGWVTSTTLLVASYIDPKKTEWDSKDCQNGGRVDFDYSQIRKAGELIKGFGGTASGPQPLIDLHNRIRANISCYLKVANGDDTTESIIEMVRKLGDCGVEYDAQGTIEKILTQEGKTYGKTRLIADIVNAIGACVVAGNVRRSAEIIIGEVGDDEFLNLKNYTLNPERLSVGWMSNNSIRLAKTEDFSDNLGDLAERIRDNGEPGIYNQINAREMGRSGNHSSSKDTRESEADPGTIPNPCAEINLESMELCCLSELFVPRCLGDNGKFSMEVYLQAAEYATFYASTVSLLPTSWKKSNVVITRNHRIGVSMTGVADHYDEYGFASLVKTCKEGYQKVRKINRHLAREAGVNESIRVTTNKPSGSVSLLAGVSPGIHFPTFDRYIRRIRIAIDNAMGPLLQKAGVPHEVAVDSAGTMIYEFPVEQGRARPAKEVRADEQFTILRTLQYWWSDNMVSVTIYFDPETEGKMLERLLAANIFFIKSCSMLPHSDAGAFPQMPYEGITKEEYLKRSSAIGKIDWESYNGGDSEMPRFCNNDTCM